MRNVHVLRENAITAPASLVANTTIQAKTRTTVVRTAVATFELTPVTPILASTAVAAANAAESNDQPSQEFRMPPPYRVRAAPGEAKEACFIRGAKAQLASNRGITRRRRSFSLRQHEAD